MKAKDLAKELLKYPDFDTRVVVLTIDNSEWGVKLDIFDVTGICDIGQSDKTIQLEIEKK